MRACILVKPLHLITIFILILFDFISLAQIRTEAYFGVSGRTDVSKDILEMYDKGYYISGGFEGSGNHHYGWNIKTDINLELLYDKVFEHSLCTVGNFVSVSDGEGNIYVSGLATISGGWPFITKIDSCGNKVWCKILQYEGEFENGSKRDILITKNNEILLLIDLDSEEEINKLHLVGLNSNGDVLWTKPYASKNDYPWLQEANAYSFTEINNEYYISGYCYYPYPNDTNHVFLRPLFIGIDSLFNEKWVLPFYALDSVYGDAYKTIPLNDSVFMGVGIRRLPYSLDFGLLMFYNKDGEEMGYSEVSNEQIGPNIQSNHFRDVASINDSLFISSSLFGPDISSNPGGVLVFDTAGNLYNILSKPNTTSAKLIKTYDNNYLFAANIEESKGDKDIYIYKIDEHLNDVPFDPTPRNYDSLCPGGIQPGNTNLDDCLIWTDIGEAPGPAQYYQSLRWIPMNAYPNPVKGGKVRLEFENTEHHYNLVLRIYNHTGHSIHSQRIYKGQQDTDVIISAWPKGFYIAVIYSNGGAVGKVKFVHE